MSKCQIQVGTMSENKVGVDRKPPEQDRVNQKRKGDKERLYESEED